MFRKTLITLGATAALGLGLSGVASASSVPVAHTYSQNLAGYSTIFTAGTAFNDVRSDVTVPSEPANPALVDTVAVGDVLQESAAGASDPTAGIGLVWNDTVNTSGLVCDNGGSPSDQWTLEAGHGYVPAGTPLPPGDLSPITGISGIASHILCVPSGTSRFYISVYDSTFHNTIGFDAGALEPGDNLLTIADPFGAGVRFHEAGTGVDTTNGAAASDLTPGTLAGFWRDGLTVLLDPSNPKGATDSRVTLDKYDMREYLGTADGTPSGTASLTPSGLGVGSAFNVIANT